MKRKATSTFDPKAFLAKVGKGRTLADYKKNQRVFSQGDPRCRALVQTQTVGGNRLKLRLVGDCEFDSDCECFVSQLVHRGIGPAEFAGLELPLLDRL